jgi:thiol-disulfide isomerase/thioredoxin
MRIYKTLILIFLNTSFLFSEKTHPEIIEVDEQEVIDALETDQKVEIPNLGETDKVLDERFRINRMLIYYFYMENCPYCDKIENKFKALVSKYPNINFVKCNIKYARDYVYRGPVPAFCVINSYGGSMFLVGSDKINDIDALIEKFNANLNPPKILGN